MMEAKIVSVTFTSPKCFYCDNPWKYILEIETIDSETKKLTGNLVEIRVCQSCRDTRLTAFEDRIRSSKQKENESLEKHSKRLEP